MLDLSLEESYQEESVVAEFLVPGLVLVELSQEVALEVV